MIDDVHRWERDPLFSAAEIVQDSADRMESIYRALLHEQSLVGAQSADQKLLNLIEYHRRDLITALGTTKWQLEDFEKAVSLSSVSDKVNISGGALLRHGQFIKAIWEQITLMEKSLEHPHERKGSGINQWPNLNEQDKEQLALFLSGGYSSDSVSYDTDRSNLRVSGDEHSASGFDDESDEIIELKVDETPNHTGSMNIGTDSCRHLDYGIQLKSTPHLNYLNHYHSTIPLISAERNTDAIEKRDQRCHGFFQGVIEERNYEGMHMDSREWELEETDNSTNKGWLKSSRSMGYLRGFLSHLASTIESKMSRSFIKRRKDGETSDDLLLDIGQMTSSSAAGISDTEQSKYLGPWPASHSSGPTFCLEGVTKYIRPQIWVGSFQRKFLRIQNLVQCKQFPVRPTSVMFITLGFVGLLAFQIV